MTTFQTIILGVFGFFIIAGLLVIATTKSRGAEEEASVALWGAAPAAQVQALSEKVFPKNLRLSYREIPEDELDQTLIESLASGRGPDMILLPLELLLRQRDRLQLIPYANYSERQFKDAFIGAADSFLLPQGIAALPFSVDPMVMYWNRGLFDAAGVSEPPKFWDEFLLLPQQLTKRDSEGGLAQSAVGLGEYRNIAHAKEILATLLLQSGTAPVMLSGGTAVATLASRPESRSVIDFYTEFANPQKTIYSWNRGQPLSRQAFLASRLAIYFGFGSELSELRRGNANLNFDAALFPSPRGSTIPLTYGKLTGVALLRTTRNPSAALQTALLLTSAEAEQLLAEKSGLPPARRALLARKPADAFASILYGSALRARGFPDPNPQETDSIFRDMIESITSGKARSGDALSRAERELRSLVH